ncbi:MAG: hypothetical protein ABL960_10610 [Nitrospira sp.]
MMTFESRIVSQREFVVAQLQTARGWMSPVDAVMLREAHTNDISRIVRQMAGRVICDYQGREQSIESLVQQLQSEVTGQRCIPDDMEYAYAAKVIAVSHTLGPIGREALQVYTGYRNEDLSLLREDASQSLSEAMVSLYGSPWE